jgi:hypothetical protein
MKQLTYKDLCAEDKAVVNKHKKLLNIPLEDVDKLIITHRDGTKVKVEPLKPC